MEIQPMYSCICEYSSFVYALLSGLYFMVNAPLCSNNLFPSDKLVNFQVLFMSRTFISSHIAAFHYGWPSQCGGNLNWRQSIWRLTIRWWICMIGNKFLNGKLSASMLTHPWCNRLSSNAGRSKGSKLGIRSCISWSWKWYVLCRDLYWLLVQLFLVKKVKKIQKVHSTRKC